MSNSTGRRSGGKASRKKPKKPRKDFPLYAHAVGRWAKKCRGKTVYFTSWRDDPKGQAALEMWLEQKDALVAGREPRPKSDELTVAGLCNEFLAHKEGLRDNGELSPRTFRGYYDSCERVVKVFGKSRSVVDLLPPDFAKLRKELAKNRAAVALRVEMQRVRSVFNFAFDQVLIVAPVRFGASFAKPRLATVDKERAAFKAENGLRMFEADEIRQILAVAKQPLRAMVLLGANCGFGQSDLSSLPVRAVNLETGWVDYGRPKTGVPRKIPLWAETIEAIGEWLPARPKARDKKNAGLMFLTRIGGRWVSTDETGGAKDAVGQAFGRVLRELGLKRPRLNFYALRHTFETVAGETADQVAVDCVMGHKRSDMASAYRERIGDDRLRRVVDHVHAWLFGNAV